MIRCLVRVANFHRVGPRQLPRHSLLASAALCSISFPAHPVVRFDMKLILGLVLTMLGGVALAQTPEWIWFDNKGQAPEREEVRYFRKSFQAPANLTKAVVTHSADDRATVFINGIQVAENRNWNR